MLLKDTFYTIHSINSENNSHQVEVKIDGCHPIFEGHFPGQPVVPGVCTIQMIKECLCELLGKSVRYTAIPSCKFTSFIIPSDDFVVLSLKIADDVTSVQASVSMNQTTMLKMKANIVAE